MPIILAIEPDRRQAAHLAGVVRQRVQAELILADTTEGALDAIGDRVPDMVLVPALLSPQDDAALAAALRVIAAAAHVRTLTIPVLSNGTKRSKPGGLLAKWRGRAESPAPDGCDPSVFAEQINAYLQEAAAERAALARELDDAAETEDVLSSATLKGSPSIIEAAQPIEMTTTEVIAFAAPDPIPFTAPDPIAFTAPAPIAFATPDPIALAAPAPMESLVVEPIEAWAAEPIELPAPIEPIEPPAPIEPIEPLAAVALIEDQSTPVWADGRIKPAEFDVPQDATVDGQTDIDLSAELDGLAEESPDEELFAGERVGVYTISSVVDEPEMEAFDLLPVIMGPAPIAQHAAAPVADASREEAFVEPALIESSIVEEHLVEELVVTAPVVDQHVVEELVVAAPVVEERVVEEYPVEEFVVEDVMAEEAPAPRSDVEPWVPMYLTPGRMWPPLEGVLAEAATSLDEFQAYPEEDPIAAFVQVEMAQPEPRPEARPAAASPKPDNSEWLELIASLRQDIERRRGEPASMAAPKVAARPAGSGDGNGNQRVKKQKTFGKKSKPVQDEWGFFDPEQCGFSALLAKLEEITDLPEEPNARRPS